MAEPAVPGVEEIARALCVSEGKDPDFDYNPLGLGRPAGTDLRWRCYEKQARAILDLFAPILAEKDREIERLRYMFTEQRSQYEAALAGERERVQQVLEPFDDALGEDDEGYGDGLTIVMKWGACTDYSVTLGDLRDVRKLAAAIRAQGTDSTTPPRS